MSSLNNICQNGEIVPHEGLMHVHDIKVTDSLAVIQFLEEIGKVATPSKSAYHAQGTPAEHMNITITAACSYGDDMDQISEPAHAVVPSVQLPFTIENQIHHSPIDCMDFPAGASANQTQTKPSEHNDFPLHTSRFKEPVAVQKTEVGSFPIENIRAPFRSAYKAKQSPTENMKVPESKVTCSSEFRTNQISKTRGFLVEDERAIVQSAKHAQMKHVECMNVSVSAMVGSEEIATNQKICPDPHQSRRRYKKCPHGNRFGLCLDIACNGCVHGILRQSCTHCCSKCSHGNRRAQCPDIACNGCVHGILRLACIHCCRKCQHGNRKNRCPDIACNGCEHGVLRLRCVHCGSTCSHGFPKLLKNCMKCHGCVHGKRTIYCHICCDVSFRCDHGVPKTLNNCLGCYGCIHGNYKRSCSKCIICPHNMPKADCSECSSCKHGRLHSSCPECIKKPIAKPRKVQHENKNSSAVINAVEMALFKHERQIPEQPKKPSSTKRSGNDFRVNDTFLSKPKRKRARRADRHEHIQDLNVRIKNEEPNKSLFQQSHPNSNHRLQEFVDMPGICRDDQPQYSGTDLADSESHPGCKIREQGMIECCVTGTLADRAISSSGFNDENIIFTKEKMQKARCKLLVRSFHSLSKPNRRAVLVDLRMFDISEFEDYIKHSYDSAVAAVKRHKFAQFVFSPVMTKEVDLSFESPSSSYASYWAYDYFESEVALPKDSLNRLPDLFDKENHEISDDHLEIVSMIPTQRCRSTETKADLTRRFQGWLWYTTIGRQSVLLYGCGSKYTLLEQFKRFLGDKFVISVDGFDSRLIGERDATKWNLEVFIEHILLDNFAMKAGSRIKQSGIEKSIQDIGPCNTFLNLIKMFGLEVYLIVHNLDGSHLKTAYHEFFAKFKSLPTTRVIASVDNINANQLVQNDIENNMDWKTIQISTLREYRREMCMSCFEKRQIGRVSIPQLVNMLRARYRMFELKFVYFIAKHLLENPKPGEVGVDFATVRDIMMIEIQEIVVNFQILERRLQHLVEDKVVELDVLYRRVLIPYSTRSLGDLVEGLHPIIDSPESSASCPQTSDQDFDSESDGYMTDHGSLT